MLHRFALVSSHLTVSARPSITHFARKMSIAQQYEDIISRLPEKFKTAQAAGELLFFPSNTTERVHDGKKFEVRICPALKDKRKSKEEVLAKVGVKLDQEDECEKSSPFEPPYVEELHVGELEGIDGEEGMAVLLNKYSVVPEHFLLVSKSYQPQVLPPNPSQLLTAYNLLLSAAEHPSRPQNLLAFYNGGPGAGASQDWRHLQVIKTPRRGAPLESWLEGVSGPKDKAFPHPDLPYLHLLYRLPTPTSQPYPPTEQSNEKMMHTLGGGLMALLDEMFDALRRAHARSDGGWNLLMTLNYIHLIPRAKPAFPLSESDDSVVEVNSLGYAGMVLVKDEEELAAVEAATSDEGFMQVLKTCGVPREWGHKQEEEEGALASQSVGH